MRIILRHLLPGFTSHIVVSLTLALPGMILGETALSFLGLGLRPPITSWGVLLQEAQNVQAVALHSLAAHPSPLRSRRRPGLQLRRRRSARRRRPLRELTCLLLQ